MSANSAKMQFLENLRGFGDPLTQPEKYNLYNGLVNLAAALENLELKLSGIEQQIRQLGAKVGR